MTKIDSSFGDPKKSEDQKYIETLMADMGLQDLNDLSPSERKAFINASKPTYKMKRKSNFIKYYNISKFSNKKISNVLILIHPDALMEKGLAPFEEYIEKIRSHQNYFDKVYIYLLFDRNGVYVNRIFENNKDLKKIYEDLLKLESNKVSIKKGDNQSFALSLNSDEMYSFFMDNENMDIFISGGYQDMCLRGACDTIFLNLDEHIKAFDHEVFLYKDLVYTSGKRDEEKGVPQIGALNYPSYETTYDNVFPKITKDDSSGKVSWFDKMNVVSEDDIKNENLEKNAKRRKKRDPKKGTGKKPKGSGRRLYTDENPKDTCKVSFTSVSAIRKTFSTSCFKSKSHARQSQIINLVHQRVRAAHKNAKDPKVKKRLKKALEYAEKRKESSKKKTERLRKKKSFINLHTLYKVASKNMSIEELINDPDTILEIGDFRDLNDTNIDPEEALQIGYMLAVENTKQ